MTLTNDKQETKEQGWHNRLMCGLGASGPEFDSQILHPCFNFFPFRVAKYSFKYLENGAPKERGSKMSAPSTSGLSVELLLRVIDAKYGYFTFT